MHSLNKAYKAALKSYGQQHFSTLSMLEALEQEKKLLLSINRINQPKPTTEISTVSLRKHTSLQIVYNW